MERRESSERKNAFIRVLIIAILLLLAFLSTIIYVFAYPKSIITLKDEQEMGREPYAIFEVKKYSTLENLKDQEKLGHRFVSWVYDNGQMLDKSKEVDVDFLTLYARFERLEYNVNFYVQVKENGTFQDKYKLLYSEEVLFNESIRTLYGTVDDRPTNPLIPELTDRIGYHFVGWTTKVDAQDNLSRSDYVLAGEEFPVVSGTDVDLYAYWEKNEYEVVTHTGNSYEGLDKVTGNGVPVRDSNGEFIIRNDRVENNIKIKYLDKLSTITTVTTPTLTEEDGIDYGEYEFKGWFLDEELTISAEDISYTVVVKREDGEDIPYLAYVDGNNQTQYITAELVDGKHQFHLYSKWERKSYTLSFNNNSVGSNGKIASIDVYKYDDHYGRHYSDQFVRDNAQVQYCSTIDLKDDINVTTETFLKSYKNWRFVGWSTTPLSDDEDSVKYYEWKQNDVVYDEVGNIVDQEPYYTSGMYTHTVSEDVMLYATWSRIRTVTFYERSGANRFNGKSHVVEGIAGEWFALPSSKWIEDNGWYLNSYTEFAGWSVGTHGSDTPILEFEGDSPNPKYYWTFKSSTSLTTTICACWRAKTYTIIYHHNDGTGNNTTITAKGNTQVSFPNNITRENYIFDGWTYTPYEDNVLGKSVITATSFRPVGENTTIEYYASWTQKFTVKYDFNVSDGSVTASVPNSVVYSKKNGNQMLEVRSVANLSSASGYVRRGYTFKGWVFSYDKGSSEPTIILPGKKYYFNFAGDENNGKYCYRDGFSSTKIPFTMDGDGAHTVTLYALWEPKTYDLVVYDTYTGESSSHVVTYGVDINLLDYVVTDHIGRVFIGISTTENGEIQYSPSTTMVIPGTDIIGNMVFYSRYEVKFLTIEYRIGDANNYQVYTPGIGMSGYNGATIQYNSSLTLPQLPSTTSSEFSHWYYVDVDDAEVPVYTGDKVLYSGDHLILWAKFSAYEYYLTFRFSNPNDNTDYLEFRTDTDGNQFVVPKGGKITSEIYTYVMTALQEYLESKDIKQYTFDGLFNYYGGESYIFAENKDLSVTNFPIIDGVNGIDVKFVTMWSANEVAFEYIYNYEDAEGNALQEVITGKHSGNNYDTTTPKATISVGASVTFANMETGVEVNRWYLVDGDGEKFYLEKNVSLVGWRGVFSSVSEMKNYIVWEYDNSLKEYIGYIRIYAETQQIFSITYYSYQNGTLREVGSDSHIFNEVDGKILSLSAGSIATYGDLVFNGWVIYNGDTRISTVGSNGLVSTGSFEIDLDTFTTYDIYCYADMSFEVRYFKLVEDGENLYEEELTSTSVNLIKNTALHYNDISNYLYSYTINTNLVVGENGFDVPTGYEYYGYKIDNVVYSQAEVSSGVTLSISSLNGDNIDILAYLVNQYAITYTLGEGETFEGDDYEDLTSLTEYYLKGYDGLIVAKRVYNTTPYTETRVSEVRIPNINVIKPGYVFEGWQYYDGETIYSTVYGRGQTITLFGDSNYVTYFTTPEAGEIEVFIKYYDRDGNQLGETITAHNGDEYEVLSGDILGFTHALYAISGWTCGGSLYKVGSTFFIPLLVNDGTTYEFHAEISSKYTVVFETYGGTTINNIVTFADAEIQLTTKPTLANEYEFKTWQYDVYGDGSQMINIGYNDIIKFVSSATYKSTALIEGNYLHELPILTNTYLYTLYAVAITEISINLSTTVQDVVYNESIIVPYGHTFSSVRDLIFGDILVAENSNLVAGIVAWTTDPENTEATHYEDLSVLDDNIKRVVKDVTLYAVWQASYVISYAVSDDNFGYDGDSVPDAVKYFEGDEVSLNSNIVKLIYFKGYNTVYYSDGTYIVYNDESSTEYYKVSGFKYFVESTEQAVSYPGGTFTMPGCDITLTPIMERVYQVKFNRNTLETPNSSEDLSEHTVYVDTLANVVLTDYLTLTTRVGFTLKGWNTDATAESQLTSLSDVEDSNITLYAVWSNNNRVSFRINSVEIFSVSLTRLSKINMTELNTAMASTSGVFRQTKLAGNIYTYIYNNVNYYFDHFTYGSSAYTMDTIANVVFKNYYDVNILMDNVYTINYCSNSEPTSNSYVVEQTIYGTQDGIIVANSAESPRGIESSFVTLDLSSFVSEYMQAYGWLDGNSILYPFNTTVDGSGYSNLLTTADSNYVVTLKLYWSPKDFSIKLNHLTTPYTTYSQVDSADELLASATWTDVASQQLTDVQGNSLVSASVKYGSSFVVQFDKVVYENYVIVGWSKTPYPLGYNPTVDDEGVILVASSSASYSQNVVLDETLFNEDGEVSLYPIWATMPNHYLEVSGVNGGFSYRLTTTSQLQGFMVDESGAVDTSAQMTTSTSAIGVYLTFYNSLLLVGDQPTSDIYALSSIDNTIGTVTDNSVVVLGTDVGECTGEGCTESVVFNYSIRKVTINATLEYNKELSTDTTTITLTGESTVVLNKDNKSASFEVVASSNVDVILVLDNAFNLSQILTGKEDNQSSIVIVNNKLAVRSMVINEDDTVDLKFCLTPKTYTVSLMLQGGELSGDITYNSPTFGGGVAVYEDGQFVVYQDATITIPQPTKAKSLFAYWTFNYTTDKPTQITDFAVTSNISIIANYTSTVKTITYYLHNGSIAYVDFASGEDISVGRDDEGNLISSGTSTGYNHLGWEYSGTIYTDDTLFATEFRNYSFVQVVEGKDITIEFVQEYNSEIIGEAGSITVKYGERYTIPSSDDIAGLAITGKALYGFSTLTSATAGRPVFKSGQIVDLVRDLGLDVTSSTVITLYTIYFKEYTYNFIYNTNNTIESGEYNISANSEEGRVDDEDLFFKISDVIPTTADTANVFAGYVVTVNYGETTITLQDEDGNNLLVSAGEVLNLINPQDCGFVDTYTYTFTPTFAGASGTSEFRIYITNPNDETSYLTIDEDKEYYSMQVFTHNKVYSSSLPTYTYVDGEDSVNWSFASGLTGFTTTSTGMNEHKLLGFEVSFQVYSGDGEETIRTEELLFASEEGYSLGGNLSSYYTLLPIWEDRYSVSYYDTSATLLEITYYDIGSTLTVSDRYNYDVDGFVFVGYAQQDGVIATTTEDYVVVGSEFVITNSNYTFYPVFSTEYVVQFDSNLTTLTANGGNASRVNVVKNNSFVAYVGMPAVSLADYYQATYSDIGYSYEGFILSDDMANSLDGAGIEVINEYTFQLSHLTGDNVILYVAWRRAECTITFVFTAQPNGSNDYVNSNQITETLLFGQTYNLSAPSAQVQEEIDGMMPTYQFKNYSYGVGGVVAQGTITITADIIIAVNFDYVFTIKYIIGEDVQYKDGAEQLPENVGGIVGQQIEGYDADTNLFMQQSTGLYWVVIDPIDSSDVKFFENNVHTFTEDDKAYANENYEIELCLRGGLATYNVKLYTYYTLGDIKNNTYASTPIEITLAGKTPLFNYDSVEVDESGEFTKYPSSPFDGYISGESYASGQTNPFADLNITTLYELMNVVFVDDGYISSGSIKVNDETILVDNYEAKSYSSETVNVFTNEIYLLYEYADFLLRTMNIVVADQSDIGNGNLQYTTNSSLRTYFYKNDKTMSVTGAFSISYVTVGDIFTLVATDETKSENLGHNFIGFYSPVYDNEGKIIDLQAIASSDWNAENSEQHKYRVARDGVELIAVYTEKPVILNITYKTPSTDAEDLAKLKTKITLDETVVTEDQMTIIQDTTAMEVRITIKALYGQRLFIVDASEMPFEIVSFTSNGITLERVDFLTVLTNLAEDLDEINLTINFDLKMHNVYVSTYLNSIEDFPSGVLQSVNYINYNGETGNSAEDGYDIQGCYVYNSGVFYNNYIELPYGYTVTQLVILASNYTVTGYRLNGGTNSITSLNNTLTDTLYISVVFAPNNIQVAFCTTSGIDGELDGEEKIVGYLCPDCNSFVTSTTCSSCNKTIGTIPYGSLITLPYVVIEETKYISKGWTIEGSEYVWGEEVYAVSPLNTLLEDNILRIYANAEELYHLVFEWNSALGDEPSGFEKYKTRNELIVAKQNITISSSYYYINAVNLNNMTYNTVNVTPNTSATVVYSTIEFPDILNQSTNQNFGGWLTPDARLVSNMYTCNSAHVTNSETNEIKLVAHDNGKVILKFYITNPTTDNEESNYYLASSANDSAVFDIPAIQYVFDGSTISVMYTPIANTDNTILGWGNYFMKNDDDLLTNYEFLGWSTVRQGAITSPSSQLSNVTSNASLLYQYSITSGNNVLRTSISLTEQLNKLTALASSNAEFYSVWEKKHVVVFDASDSQYTNSFEVSGKYAEGEIITIPNNQMATTSTFYHDLINGSNKWTGWEDATKGITLSFSDYEEGGFAYTVPSQDINFAPMWSAGVQVYFHINFDSWRDYFGEAMSSTVLNTQASTITSVVGYPYINPNITDVEYYGVESSQVTINGTSYYKTFKEGNLYQLGDYVNIYKYLNLGSDTFVQTGIYGQYGTLDSYFSLRGWYYDANHNGVCDAGEEISYINNEGQVCFEIVESMMTDSGTLNLYARWTPVNFAVEFYKTQEGAQEGGYLDRFVDDSGNYVTLYVPFGYKITDNLDYVIPGSQLLYIYMDTATYFLVEGKVVVPHDNADLYRFSYWVDVDTGHNVLNNASTEDYTAGTVSSVVTDTVRLYPQFIEQYVVNFVTEDLATIDSSLTQYVVDGETIAIRSAIEASGYDGILSAVYYYTAGMEVVTITDENTITFVASQFYKAEKGGVARYINIYFKVNLVVRAYTPSLTSLGEAELFKEVEIKTNTIYSLRSMSELSLGNSYSDYIFAGWGYGVYDENYYSSDNTSSPAFEMNNTISTLKVSIGDAGEYSLIINGSETIEMASLVVNIYAQLYIMVSVDIKNSAYSLASLSYTNEISANEGKYYNAINTGKSLKVFTMFNSPYFPTITVDTVNGYRVSSYSDTITEISKNDTTFVESYVNVDNVESYIPVFATPGYVLNLGKTTSVVADASGNPTLKTLQTIKARSVYTNSLALVVDVSYITLDITYKVDMATPGALVEGTKTLCSWSGTMADNDYSEGVEYSIDDTSKSFYANGAYESFYKVVLKITTETTSDGTFAVCTLEGVPYNATIRMWVQFSSYNSEGDSQDSSMEYSFSGWNTVGVQASQVGNIQPKTQTFSPTLMTTDNPTSLKKNYELVASASVNTLSSITFQFVIDVDAIAFKDPWASLVEKNYVNHTNRGGKQYITWTPNAGKAFKGVSAGSDISDLLAKVNAEYDANFNRNINTGSAYNINNLATILNYFWFSGSWSVQGSNGKIVQETVTTDSGTQTIERLYFSSTSVVLETILTPAHLLEAYHQNIHFTNDKVLNGDKADISHNVSDNADGIKILHDACDENNRYVFKIRNSNLKDSIEFTVTPNEGYNLKQWRCGTGDPIPPTDNKYVYNIDNDGDSVTDLEIKLVAQVSAEGLTINFVNDDDSVLSTISIAYGTGEYDYTLKKMYDNKQIPVFGEGFISSVDSELTTKQYGTYTKLFSYWGVSEDGGITKYDADTVITSDMTFKAVYVDTVPIAYATIGLDADNNSYESYQYYYLLEHTDQFGVVRYSGVLTQLSSVGGVLSGFTSSTNKYYVGSPHLAEREFVVPDNDEGPQPYLMSDIEEVFTVAGIVASGKTKTIANNGVNFYIVYPTINYTFKVEQRIEDKSSSKEYSVVTLGGVYYANMDSDGDLVISNVLSMQDEDENLNPYCAFAYMLPDDHQFAFWQVVKVSVNSREVLYNIPTMQDGYYATISNLSFVSYYNPKFSVDAEDNMFKGSVYCGKTQLTQSTTYTFSETQPTQKTLLPSSNNPPSGSITNRIITLSASGNTIIFNEKIEDDGGTKTTKLYEFVYKFTTSADAEYYTLAWEILSYNDETYLLKPDTDTTYVVSDIEGTFSIAPILMSTIERDVDIKLEAPVVTNYTSYDLSQLLGTIENSSNITTTTNSTVSRNGDTWYDSANGTILLKVEGSGKPKTIGYTVEKNKNVAPLKNIRWQYKIDDNWIDFDGTLSLTQIAYNSDSSTNENAKITMYVRIACDWKTVTLTLATLGAFKDSTFAQDTKNDYSILPAKNYESAKLSMSTNTLLGEKFKSKSFTIYYGDTVRYNKSGHKIVITRTFGGKDTIVPVGIDSGSSQTSVMNGWYKLGVSSTDSSEYAMGDILVNAQSVFNEGDFDSNKSLIVVAWIDPVVEVTILPPTEEVGKISNVEGVGTISVTTSAPNGDTTETEGIVYDSGKGYYTQLTVGASHKLTIKGSYELNSTSTPYMRAVLYKYNDQDVNIVQEKGESVSIDMSQGHVPDESVSASVYVSFEAEKTKSLFVIKNTAEETQAEYPIYSGYTITITESDKNFTITISDMFGSVVKNYYVYKEGVGTTEGENIYPSNNHGAPNYTLTIDGESPEVPFKYEGSKYVNKQVIYTMIEAITSTTIDLITDVTDVNGVTSSNYYWQSGVNNSLVEYTDNAGGAQLEITNSDNQYTQINLTNITNDTKLRLSYNINAGKMGMQISFVHNGVEEVVFVRASSGYEIVSLVLYREVIDSKNVVLSKNYYDPERDSYDGKISSTDATAVAYTHYQLVFNVKPRTTSNVSFQTSLPHASDLENLRMTANFAITNGESGVYSIKNYAKDESRDKIIFNRLAVDITNDNGASLYQSMKNGETYQNTDKYSKISSSYSVCVSGNDLVFIGKDGNEVGRISLNYDTSLYTFGGWHIAKNGGVDIMIKNDVDGVSKYEYGEWGKYSGYEEWTQLSNDKVLLDDHVTIYLYMTRKPITIKYSEGTIWKQAVSVGYNMSDAQISNINNLAQMLTAYQYMGVQTLTVPGGLAIMYVSDFNGETVMDASGKHTEPKGIGDTLRGGNVYINIHDSDAYSRVKDYIDKKTPQGTSVTFSPLKDFTNPSTQIIPRMGGSNLSSFNVYFSGADEYYLIGMPCNPNESTVSATVNIYSWPLPTDKERKDEGYNDTSCTSISMRTGTNSDIVLYDGRAFGQLSTSQNAKPSITTFLYRKYDSRLYAGTYLDGYILQYSYDKIGITFNCPASVWANCDGVPNKVAMLVGYTVVANGTTKHYLYTEGGGEWNHIQYCLTLSGVFTTGGVVNIYPIWQDVDLVKVTFYTAYDVGNITNGQTFYVAPGNFTINLANLSSITLANYVTSSIATEKTFYSYNKNNHVFMGFTTDSKYTPYSTSSSLSSLESTAFNNYGLLRVKGSTSSYEIATSKAYSTGGVSHTLTIPAEKDITLYALWQEKSYTINYSYNGYTYAYDASGKAEQGYMLDDYANKKNMTGFAQSVTYNTYLKSMPFPVGQGFQLSTAIANGGNKYNEKYFSVYYFFRYGTYGKDIVSNKMQFYDTVGITFNLLHLKESHNDLTGGCMEFYNSGIKCTHDEKKTLAGHKTSVYASYYCIYCKYHNDDLTEMEDNIKYGDYTYLNETQCCRDGECKYCGYTNTEKREHDVNTTEVYAELGVSQTVCIRNSYACRYCRHAIHILAEYPHEWSSLDTNSVKWKGNNCENGGTGTYKCSKCRSFEKTDEVAGITHSFGPWINDTDVACGVSGSRYRDCTNPGCKHTELGIRHHYYTGELVKNGSGNVKISTIYVTNPDDWNCYGQFTYVQLLCKHCRQSDDGAPKIRIMMQELFLGGSTNNINDKDGLGLSKLHSAPLAYWAGGKKQQCKGCGQTIHWRDRYDLWSTTAYDHDFNSYYEFDGWIKVKWDYEVINYRTSFFGMVCWAYPSDSSYLCVGDSNYTTNNTYAKFSKKWAPTQGDGETPLSISECNTLLKEVWMLLLKYNYTDTIFEPLYTEKNPDTGNSYIYDFIFGGYANIFKEDGEPLFSV